MPNRRQMLQCAAAALVAAPSLARAQFTAGKPLFIVFPFAAGGVVDGLVRAIATHLADELNVPVLVDNKPGAGSAIGATYVARAPKDGHTLLWGTYATFVTNFLLQPDLKIKIDDFSVITPTIRGFATVAVPQALPVNNFAELLLHVQKTGGRIEYGSIGTGTPPHLLMELAQTRVKGVEFVNVPYKTESQGILELLSGNLPMFVGSMSNMDAHQGKGLKIIAVSSPQRMPKAPHIPTFAEAGFPELNFTYWHGLAAPAGTPVAAISRVNQSIRRIMELPDIQAKLAIEQSSWTTEPAEFRRVIDADSAKWAAVIRERNIRI